MLKSNAARACLVFATACSHQQPPPATPASNVQPSARPAETRVDDAPLHTFAELVRSAVQRDGKSESPPSCLLRREASGHRFVGEIAVGIRPLPLPAVDLEDELEQSVSVNVLTSYGRYGDAPAGLSLSAFSYAPPTREALVVLLTDHGSYVRGVQAAGPMHNRIGLSEVARIASEPSGATVFVAAEAEVPLTQLEELLSLLATRGATVALAVNLAPNTTLPAPPASPDTLCPDGLPETSTPEGQLPISSLTPALTELRTRAADCLTSANARGAAGGHMTLTLRVAPNGTIEGACLLRDETGDPVLRACLVAEAKKLGFPAPSPSGSVDLALPLALKTPYRPAPKAVCSTSAD